MAKNYLREKGAGLFDLGYDIIPIKNKSKAPLVSNWNDLEVTKEKVSSWAGRGAMGVGLRTRRFPCIDIDVPYQSLAIKISEYARERLGLEPPIRIGQEPKMLLVCRSDKPFRKIMSAAFTNPLDLSCKPFKVEILGDGQQAVLFGTHPDTGLPYRWPGNEITETMPDFLPTLTRELAIDIIEKYEELAKDFGYVEVSGRKTDRPSNKTDLFEVYKPPKPIDVQEIEAALDTVDPDEYETWIRVGMALYYQFDGSPEGLSLWDEWSSRSAKYENNGGLNAIDTKWNSFEARVGSDPVTIATVFHLSGEVKKQERQADPLLKKTDEDLNEFLRRYVFVIDKNRVVDLDSSTGHAVRDLSEFHNEHASFKMEIQVPKENGGFATKWVPGSKQWLSSRDRKTVRGLGYHLCSEKLIPAENSNEMLFNQFWIPNHPAVNPDEVQGRVKIFVEHINYLFPCENERKWFTQWMGYNIQMRAARTRCKVTPLLVTDGVEGTGRGSVCKILEKLVGIHNTSKTDIPQITGENSAGSFNGYLKNSMFCFVEEVRDSSKRYELSDKLKDTLEADYLDINIKHGEKGLSRVYTSFLMMTNEPDAIVLPAGYRRVQVLQGPSQANDSEYYERFHLWADDPVNISAVFKWLEGVDLSDFNYTHADRTLPGFKRMVETTTSDTESVLNMWLNDTKPKAFLPGTVCDVVRDYARAHGEGEVASNLNRKSITAIMKRKTVTKDRVRLDGTKSRPWVSFLDVNFANEATPETISAELSRCGFSSDKSEKGEGGVLEFL